MIDVQKIVDTDGRRAYNTKFIIVTTSAGIGEGVASMSRNAFKRAFFYHEEITMKPFSRRATAILILLAAILLTTESFSQQYAGVLTGTQKDQTVTLNVSPFPYLIRNEYFVPQGKELIIKPGVKLLADRDSELSVSGRLEASGTKEQPIVFAGKADGSSYWKGILAKDTKGIALEWIKVSGASIGVHLNSAEASVSACMFSGNDTGLKTQGKFACTVKDVLIQDNKGDGLVAWDNTSYEACTITGNGGWGIVCNFGPSSKFTRMKITGNGKGGVVVGWMSVIEITDSIIADNKAFDVEIQVGDDCDLSRNWWGVDATRKLIAEGETVNLPNINDGHDDREKGKARLDEFLRQEPRNVGAFATKDAANAKETVRVGFSADSYLISDSKYFNGFYQALGQNNAETVQKYIKANYVVAIPKGTTAEVIAEAKPAYGVRILDGEHKGKQGWVRKQDVAEQKNEE